MSGFAGIVSTAGATPDSRLLERMAALLAFRGPDATHISTQTGAGFCFTFLRTGPAPQSSSQPCSLDGRVWLLGDVRLDAREDLCRRLEQNGESIPAGITDEELVLHLWSQLGEAGFAELLGDFSFALWDSTARHLWCVRDLMGPKPFFYAQAGGWLYFSNTLDAIRCAPGVTRALDLRFIGDFLLEGWCPDLVRTAFRDISRLPAGHVLRYSSDGLQMRRYISLPIEEPLWLKRPEEYVERFRELLEQAVRERLPQGPAAIFLSGGLDSTSVAAVATDTAKRNATPSVLRGYTVDYQPLFDDPEGRLASRAAQYLGIPLEVLPGASYLPFANWDDCPPPMPEPFHEPFRKVYLEQIRRVAEHTCVTLSGYGGDGILTGQAWPYLIDLLQRLRFGKIGKSFGGYIIKHGRIPPLRGGFRSTLRRWLGRSDPMADYPQWLVTQFEKDLRLRERWRELRRPLEKLHPWYPDAHAMLNGGSWATVLESEDPAWTGAPMELRAPLLDLRILHFLLRVPPVPLCVDKELLRKAMRGLLPEEIRSRPKTPLVGDVFALQMECGRWNPLPLPAPPEALRTLVHWEKLGATLENGPIFFPGADLRPVSLLYWVKAVENGQ